MKFRSTLILFALAAGVFAYISLVESRRPSTKEARERALLMAQVDRDSLSSITIKNPETQIELRKHENGVWYLEEPVKDRADSMAIQQLFTTVEYLRHDAQIAESGKNNKAQLKEFGLANSEIRLKLAGSQDPVEVILGKDAAVEGKTYARLEGSDLIHVIGSDLKTQLLKKADDFRDRKLTEVSTAQVRKAVIQSESGQIEFERKDQQWSLLKPLKARGEASKIGDLLSQATTARVEKFVADSANLAAYGLQEPRGSVSLYMEDVKEPVVLQIGAHPQDDPERVYAKLSTRDSVVLLPKSIEALLQTKPNDLRDRNLLRVEADIVDRMTLEPAGKEKIVLARSGEGWVRKAATDLPVNPLAANALLKGLAAMQVADFEADVASDLPQFGLDAPQLRITLSSFASENTAESSAGEKPIVTLLLGGVEGDRVYAKLDDEPFVVSLPKAVLAGMPADPVRWQPLGIFKLKPEDIVAVEIARAGQPPISIERDKETWKLSKGDGNINQSNAQSLVNTLAALRAVRWTGSTVFPEDGLEAPALSVSFRTADPAQPPRVLWLGATTPTGMTRSSTDALAGVFEVNKPDKEAFDLPLVEKAPVPPAAPAAQ